MTPPVRDDSARSHLMSSQLGWARVRDDSVRSSPCRGRRMRRPPTSAHFQRLCCNDVLDLHAAEVLWQSSIHGFQERLKSKQLDLPRAVRDSMFQFRKQAFPNSRLAHELTHLQNSIQEGSGTRDPHEDCDQWKFQENNRHTQRYKYVNRARASEKAWGEKGFEPRTPWRKKGTTQQVSQG